MKEPKPTDDVDAVLREYALQITGVQLISDNPLRYVWEIQTDKGKKILKKSQANRERVQFISEAVEHLRKQGVLMPAELRTTSGNTFAQVNGICYVLTEFYTGTSPDYKVPNDMEVMMKTMAGFHLASQGFEASNQTIGIEHLGRWEANYYKIIENFEYFKSFAVSANPDLLGIFIHHTGLLEAMTQEAIQGIQSGSYRHWVEKVAKHKNICHQDFTTGNVIKTGQGLVVIDTDTLTYDLPARDLRKIINKVMKRVGWNEAFLVQMLRNYHSVFPLDRTEYEVLYYDLMFPHSLYGSGSKNYQKRDQKWKPAHIPTKFKELIRIEQAKKQILSNWDRIIQHVIK